MCWILQSKNNLNVTQAIVFLFLATCINKQIFPIAYYKIKLSA